MILYSNIPDELKALPQWVLWAYEDIGSAKPTKVPHSVHGGLANVNDPTTWATFDKAVAAAKDYSGIGFVFADDPYCFIDLDDTKGDQIALNRQIEIFREFDSYAEISPSGKGLHIIVRGTVPAGRRRSFIEIYSNQRYATFTGNVYPPNQVKPVKDCQDKLIQLWHQMGSGPVAIAMNENQPEKENDNAIFTRAIEAANGGRFKELYEGRFQAEYSSQSEADLALIDIISFYTKNQTQIARIFRNSNLGQRPKARRDDYIKGMILKSFDRMLPPIDFDGFKNQLELKLATNSAPSSNGRTGVGGGSNPSGVANGVQLPPGLLGELAQFIYVAAPRPVPEIALAGAIGLMAGIVGRAYNISGTGLNQYVLLLADTGTGKEAMASGIDKLMEAIRFSVPTSSNYVGPSEISSGQALVKHINRFSQCFVSVLGEFGLRIQQLSSARASSHEVMLRRMLLDLYNKSGFGQMWRGTIYADRDKNVDATKSPAFTILGESTPERFYSALNEEMISEGLLPRFLIIEYLGARPAFNKSAATAIPPFKLTDQFASLVAQCETTIHNGKVVNVQYYPEAQRMLDEFDKYADNIINKVDKDIIKQLWNRAHIKALKLSALVAVGVNMIVPTILPEYVSWAIQIVQADIKALANKFELGLIGISSSETKQQAELSRIIKEYLTRDWSYCKTYGRSKQLHDDKIITYEYLNKRLVNIAAFKNDKANSTIALKRTIQNFLDSDKIREASREQLIQKYNTTQKAYVLVDLSLLD